MTDRHKTPATDITEDNPTETRKRIPRWLKRFGLYGFLFFLIKGILWLTIGASFGVAILRYIGCES